MRPRHRGATARTNPAWIDANAIVSYNVRALRERLGWTQEAVAERLGRLTGHRLPQASISAMEGAFAGRRRRRFDAHELYLLAELFGVPIVYFFLPPPRDLTDGQVLADTGRSVEALYAAFLGGDDQLAALDDRLTQAATFEAYGGELVEERSPPSSADGYRKWRDRRLDLLAGQWAERLDEAAAVLSDFVSELRSRR